MREDQDMPEWHVGIYARLSKNRPQRCWECDGSGENDDGGTCGNCGGKGKVPGFSTNTTIQVAECRREAEELAEDRRVKLVLVGVFEEDDTGASKFSNKPRVLWDRLLDLARQDRLDTIMATEPERLYRKPKDADQIITVSETSGLRELYFTGEGGPIDLTTPNGIYEVRNTAGLGERESNKTSRRQRRKSADKARRGKSAGGHRAFGFLAGDPRLGKHYRPHNEVLNPPEVQALHDMADRFLDGWNYREIAWHLEREGIKTSEGHTFVAGTVMTMLARKRYHPHPSSPDPEIPRGIREHHGVDYVAVWPAVFDFETSEKLLLEIGRRRELKGTGKPGVRYLLTGLLYCGKCGGTMGGEIHTDRPGVKRRTYYCRLPKNRDYEGQAGCGGTRRNADALDLFIVQSMFERMESRELGELISAQEHQPDNTRLDELLDKRKAIKLRIASLEAEFMSGDGDMDMARFERMNALGQANLEAVEKEINELNRQRIGLTSIPVGKTLREAWAESESDRWKREVLGMTIERITVNPTTRNPYFGNTGMRFDPSAIDVNWRV